MRACVRVCVHARVCVCACVCVWGLGYHPVVGYSHFNVSQGTLVKAMHDASKPPLLVSPLSCPLCALRFTRPTTSVWFEACRFIFRHFSRPLVLSTGSLAVDCSVCLSLVFRLTCCWTRAALWSWNLMRCPPFPSLFHSQEKFSVLSGLAEDRRIYRSL